MLQECVDVFSKILEEKTEQWLLDNYVPKDGTYILLNMDNDFSIEKILNIKTDKKTGIVQGDTDSDYSFISYLDYYSKLIEMNKPVDSTKIIHSNNIYSFFVKKESLKEKLTDANIDGYYAVLRNPYKKYAKVNDKALYMQVEQELGQVDIPELERVYQWVKNRLKCYLEQEEIDVNGKDYLKIFFIKNDRDKTKQLFYSEGRRYILPNIYNKNDFNKSCKDGIKGLPSNNMGMNSKKPYLENKTRKSRTPYMISLDRALSQMKFFDYLAGQASKGKNNIYIDLDRNEISAFENGKTISKIETGIYLRIQQGKELEIHNISRIAGYQVTLPEPFQMKEVIAIPDKVMPLFEPGYGRKTNLLEIEALVDDVFFAKSLKYNYFTKPEDISVNDGTRKRMILMYREQLWNWFYKGNMQYVRPIIERMAFPLIVDSIGNSGIKPKHQMNLLISIMDYFNNNRRMEDKMSDVRKALREHIDCREEWMFSSDDEYYYAVGQLLNTFLGLTKSQKKSLSLINPLLNSKNDKIIKERMIVLFKKYNYAIEVTDVRIKALLGHIMRYEPSVRVNEFMLSAGFVDDNLVYKKKDNDNETEVTE